ncbi:uncharacterized protein LOC144178510 [Haemaphysalis longicornis]|uniref:Uncharacterized protein n=1 Tax=Haemaphysalis longicornis TaxID=44386 RepID=A0A9J6G194_HAELO|nr:hypothetical protein HPB48_012440 [Haemaphysalis longicornis]
MAGRGRGRAAFPEVRHQLRRPKDGDEASTAIGPDGDAKPVISKPESPILPKAKVPVQEDGVIRGVCLQFQNLTFGDSQYPILLGLLLDKVKLQKDVDEVANGMYEVCQLGPEQAEVACRALVFMAEMEVDGYKLRTKLLTRMQLEFEGFEEKAVSSPQAVLCNAILLCGFYTRCLLHGKPINPLRAPTWKYLTYMLESRKQLFLKHCFQLLKSRVKFFVRHNPQELEEFLLKLQDLVLDEKEPKEMRSEALDILKCIWQETTRQELLSKAATVAGQPATVGGQPAIAGGQPATAGGQPAAVEA